MTSSAMQSAQSAVAAVPQRIVDAWGAHDGKAFAEVFTADGSMALPGAYRKGRAEIEEFRSAGCAGPYQGTQVVGEPIDVRFLSPDVAVLTTQGGVRAAGATELSENETVIASWIVVHENDDWLLAAYHNCPR